MQLKIFKIIKNNKIKAKDISAFVFDFDGVFTDNKVIVSENGEESVICSRGDGLGINFLKKLNIPILILSTEVNKVVAKRAEKLKLNVVHGVENKKSILVKYCHENNIDFNKVLYVGNDLNDLEVMQTVGYPIAPFDSHKEIISVAKYLTKAKGGSGVIRELAEKIN
jgi:3-deoxy-D-manno-octulosonate 8-phosphate phosphatase (KDO 8-P phosphatase)